MKKLFLAKVMKANIRVKCDAPKYVRGQYTFYTFTVLYKWLITIKGLPEAAPSFIIFGLAKDGTFAKFTARNAITIESDFHDYFLAREVASNVSLLRGGLGGDILSPKREKALAFATALDEEIERRGA